MKQQTLLRLITLLILVLGVACGEAGNGSSQPETVRIIETIDQTELLESAVATLEARAAGSAADEVVTEPVVEVVEVSQNDPIAIDAELPLESSIPLDGFALENTLRGIYDHVNPSVVYILVATQIGGGSGSGFVYDTEGHIVTNNHVVAGAEQMQVIFSDGTRRDAEVVGLNEDADLAVIKVDSLPEGVEPVPLSDSNQVDVGQFVVAIGNPFGEQGSMSLGIVSALGRSLESERDTGGFGRYQLPQVIQTDAPINPGNSGGPLLNLNGEVVGVNSAIRTATGTNSGVGFSIPVNAVRLMIPEMIETGSYSFPYMGAGFASEGNTALILSEMGYDETVTGAYVSNVVEGQPSERAGLISADPVSGFNGDLITAIDGTPIHGFDDLNAFLVFNTTVGQTIDLTVLRDGEEITLPLTLSARP